MFDSIFSFFALAFCKPGTLNCYQFFFIVFVLTSSRFVSRCRSVNCWLAKRLFVSPVRWVCPNFKTTDWTDTLIKVQCSPSQYSTGHTYKSRRSMKPKASLTLFLSLFPWLTRTHTHSHTTKQVCSAIILYAQCSAPMLGSLTSHMPADLALYWFRSCFKQTHEIYISFHFMQRHNLILMVLTVIKSLHLLHKKKKNLVYFLL